MPLSWIQGQVCPSPDHAQISHLAETAPQAVLWRGRGPRCQRKREVAGQAGGS